MIELSQYYIITNITLILNIDLDYKHVSVAFSLSINFFYSTVTHLFMNLPIREEEYDGEQQTHQRDTKTNIGDKT